MQLFREYCFSSSCLNNLTQVLKTHFGTKELVFICLGSEKVLGDCLAPLIAEELRNQNLPFYIYGGLQRSINSQNAELCSIFAKTIHQNAFICVIDSMATLSQSNLGDIVLSKKYLGAINQLAIEADLFVYGVCSMATSKPRLNLSANLFNINYLKNIISQAIIMSSKTAISHKIQKELSLLS